MNSEETTDPRGSIPYLSQSNHKENLDHLPKNKGVHIFICLLSATSIYIIPLKSLNYVV